MQYIEIDKAAIENLTSYEDYQLLNTLAKNNYINHASKKKTKKKRKTILGKALAGIGASKKKTKKKRKTILGKALAGIGKGIKKATKAVGKATKTVGKAVGKATKTVGKAVGKAVEYTALIPLKPFEPLMRSMLKKRGKKPPAKFTDLVNVFYNEVVRKTSGYEHFEEIDINKVPSDHVAPAISAIVSGIIEFIKNIKRKKAQGQVLTKTEEEIYKGTVEVERQLEEKAKAEAAQSVGQKLLFDKQTQLFIVIALIAIIIIARRK